MRKQKEIDKVLSELSDKIWHNRSYLVLKEKIENGEVFIVEKWDPSFSNETYITKDTWASIKKSAQKIEKKYGRENLGPYEEFDWGEMNGRFFTIMWFYGEDYGSVGV